jgi:hypothetical protein
METQQQQPHEQDVLTTLPSELLQGIASFLEAEDVVTLRSCCRALARGLGSLERICGRHRLERKRKSDEAWGRVEPVRREALRPRTGIVHESEHGRLEMDVLATVFEARVVAKNGSVFVYSQSRRRVWTSEKSTAYFRGPRVRLGRLYREDVIQLNDDGTTSDRAPLCVDVCLDGRDIRMGEDEGMRIGRYYIQGLYVYVPSFDPCFFVDGDEAFMSGKERARLIQEELAPIHRVLRRFPCASLGTLSEDTA